jgi:alkylation response protein AidB-like acyl-CoA dehydrogenase
MLGRPYSEDHHAFRDMVRSYFQSDLAPQREDWEAVGGPPREFWRRAGDLGLLGLQVPEQYGGAGQSSFLFNAIVTEESQAAFLALGGLRVHTDICMPYFLEYANPEQSARWLPKLTTGEFVAAIAMTEPGAGSDLRSINTKAERVDGGYLVNGAKTFISNGASADLIIIVVKTVGAPVKQDMSLLVIEGDMPGFSRGKNLNKVGLKSQELSELFFEDVFVPEANLLGNEGDAFAYLMANLPQERLSISIACQAAAVAALATTIEYTRQRSVFGKPLSNYQNTSFELAACSTDIAAGQALIDQALVAHDRKELDAVDAARVKLFCSEMQGRVVDRCLQLHGGYGFIWEYPIGRAFADARASRIYGGSSEVMKIIIARSLNL